MRDSIQRAKLARTITFERPFTRLALKNFSSIDYGQCNKK